MGGYKKAHFLHFSDCGLLLNYSPAWRAPKLIVLIYLSIFVNIRRANNEVLDKAGECEGPTFFISRILAKIKTLNIKRLHFNIFPRRLENRAQKLGHTSSRCYQSSHIGSIYWEFDRLQQFPTKAIFKRSFGDKSCEEQIF